MPKARNPLVIWPDPSAKTRPLPKLAYNAKQVIISKLFVDQRQGQNSPDAVEGSWKKIESFVQRFQSLNYSQKARGTTAQHKRLLSRKISAIEELQISADAEVVSLLLTQSLGFESGEGIWERWPDDRLERFESELGAFKAELESARQYFNTLTKSDSTGPQLYLAGRLAELFFEANSRPPTQREHLELTASVLQGHGFSYAKTGLASVCKRVAFNLGRVERIPPRKRH